MSTRKNILAMGLKEAPKGTDSSAPEGRSAESIRKHVQEELKKAEAEGYDVTTYLLEADNERTLDDIRAKLNEKDHWDGVCVGFGVRGYASLTSLFENIINTVLEEAKPTPKLMFPVGPEDTFNSLKRNL